MQPGDTGDGGPAPQPGQRAQILGYLAGALLVAGPFLPWVKVSVPGVGSHTGPGTEIGILAWLAVVAGVVTLVIAGGVLQGLPRRTAGLIVVACGVVGLAVGAWGWNEVSDGAEALNVFFDLDGADQLPGLEGLLGLIDVSHAYGLWMVLGGGALACAAGLQTGLRPTDEPD